MSENLVNVIDGAALASLGSATLKLSWKDVEKAMKALWDTRGGDYEVSRQMQTAKQGADESVAAYAMRFKRLCNLMSNDTQKNPDTWQHVFLGGLRESI